MNSALAGPHVVVFAMFPGIDALDVTGPAEVFAMTNHVLAGRHPGYEVHFAGEEVGPVRTSAGVRLHVEEAFCAQGPIDTLVVPGRIRVGPDGPEPHVDPAVVAWVGRAGASAGRVASVCVGAHVTAAAGLLDGHRATTHWATAGRLAADHPAVEVDPDPIFIRSGRMWTSAGITSSMDLALALVAEDHGDETALRVARVMVMYLQRPGSQSQFSVPLSTPAGSREDLRELRRWIGEHLDSDLSVPALALRMSMSERHFARVFRAETGSTPGAFVESMRLEAARRLLERTSRLAPDIARACGFGSVESLHRAFRDRLNTSPGEYRSRFRTAA
ncbi:GlxA family transcriptional regulator [Streptomyces sp. NBC_00503]|uniref:GlxA family transcriptional regulator n=1 Tax=Streptomyces sp. NBC_00503 TaxID=2903659 RepID=UPI002E81F0C3|nr:helix-turn-helix domain-containing protein [Streptomyces sp. NBC_00503]WUD82730.1 DJ-1/PfpI family protein [Streptomyces sp. NBC_00503]